MRLSLLVTAVGSLCGWLMLADPPLVRGQERKVLAVLEIADRSGKLGAKDIGAASERLRGLLVQSGKFSVVDKSRQEGKKREVYKRLKKESWDPCSDQACRIEIGQALSADTLLQCSISVLAGECSLTCELVPLEREVAEAGSYSEFACTAGGLAEAVKDAAGQLAGVTAPPKATGAAAAADKDVLADLRAIEASAGKDTAALEAAWQETSRIAADERLPAETRAKAVDRFLSGFPGENAHAGEAQELRDRLAGGLTTRTAWGTLSAGGMLVGESPDFGFALNLEIGRFRYRMFQWSAADITWAPVGSDEFFAIGGGIGGIGAKRHFGSGGASELGFLVYPLSYQASRSTNYSEEKSYHHKQDSNSFLHTRLYFRRLFASGHFEATVALALLWQTEDDWGKYKWYDSWPPIRLLFGYGL